MNDLLTEHFKDIVDLKFTASMESQLDDLAERGGDWEATARVLADFYGEFKRELDEAERVLPKFEQRDEPTDEVCQNCGKPMVIKTGRFGRFMSCTGYPECKTTKPILKDTGVKCPTCGGMVAERKSRKGRTFYGCANYPQCDFVSWDKLAAERCKVCGDYVVEKPRRGGNVVYVCHTDRDARDRARRCERRRRGGRASTRSTCRPDTVDTVAWRGAFGAGTVPLTMPAPNAVTAGARR